MAQPRKEPSNPILSRGRPGEPDAGSAQGVSVVREPDRWRMWYSAHDEAGRPRMAYAESRDGRTWRKPALGLVDFNGTSANNLVEAEPGFEARSVLLDPDAPADRRYVLAAMDNRWWRGWKPDAPSMTRIEVSPDGLRWTPLSRSPGIVAQQNKVITLYRFAGRYHLGGYQVTPLVRLPEQEEGLGDAFIAPRTFVVWRSPLIDRWPVERTIAFYKPMRSSSPYLRGWDREEVHVGAVVSSYGNVCLGVYGQWHHPVGTGKLEYRAGAVSVDLGLILSNDGIHFREPAPGTALIRRDQELGWDRDHRGSTDDTVMLWQGSIVNAEESTHIYYGATTPGGNRAGGHMNIGLATLPLDRFGSLRLIPGNSTGQFVTCPIEVDGAAEARVNAEVPAGGSLRFALTDEEGMTELPGYGTAQNGPGVRSGFEEAIRWSGGTELPRGRQFRIRGTLTGADTKVFAVYVRGVAVSGR
jgi:hypothetical protein